MEPLQTVQDFDYSSIDASGIVDRGPFRRAALKNYTSRMSKGDTRVLFDRFVAQILANQGISWDYDPRSIYEPQQLFDALALYGPNNKPTVTWDPAIQAGVDLAWRVFAKPKDGLGSDLLDALSDDISLIKSVDLTKSAGLPTLGKKRDDAIYALDREKQIRLGTKKPNPCLGGVRTSANNKTRLVWMYPMEMTLMEARFARPLIDKFLNTRTTMAFGLYKYELGAKIAWEVEPYGMAHCLDYSKFDSSIAAEFIDVAFEIMGTWFSEEEKDLLGWDIIRKYFICTPIVMPDGHLYTGKRHGVPSGSYFTQLVDSIVNTMLLGAIFHTFDVKISWRSVFVLGDDSIFPSKRELPLEKVRNLLSNYGVKLNVEKSLTGHSHFLGADWIKSLSHSDPSKLANRLTQPERFRKYDKTRPISGQANNVIANYASQYVEAFRMVDLNYVAASLEDILANFVRMTPEFLSGSDLYRWRELITAGKVAGELSSLYAANPSSVPTVRILT